MERPVHDLSPLSIVQLLQENQLYLQCAAETFSLDRYDDTFMFICCPHFSRISVSDFSVLAVAF
jgi:hypothetical protein